MVRAYLVCSTGDADHVTAVNELHFMRALKSRSFREGVGFLQPVILLVVEALRVVDKLDDLIVFLALEQDPAVWDPHGVAGEESNASPREHHVTRFLEPGDALVGHHAKDVLKVFVVGE